MLKKTFVMFTVVLSFAVLAIPGAPHRVLHAQAAAGGGGQGRGGGGGAAAQGGGRIGSIDDRTAGMQKIDGYFPLYWEERTGSMFLEIPRLDADFLFSTGLAAGLGSNDIGLDRGQGGQGRVVSFERVGPKVLLVQGNESFRSTSPNPARAPIG